jgi:breast cancer metastasis-suppressor 1-like protein
VFDSFHLGLLDKIRRLEEDRNDNFTPELMLETALMKRKTKKTAGDGSGDKRKKPVVVSGPYVVYMLEELDIFEDYSLIKKALAQPKRKIADPRGGGERCLIQIS